jgi:hypothetical protein
LRSFARGRGLAVLTMLLALAMPTAAGAGAGGNGNGNAYGRDGVKPAPPNVKFKASKAKKKELVETGIALGAEPAAAATAESKTPPVGTVRPFVAIDFNTGGPFLTNATLRGVGKNIEVWVQNNRTFPAGDCRNANPDDLAITDDQVQSLISAFDSRMYPTESSLFSVPPDRDGANSQLPFDYSGDGDKIVTLVMNIRDENYVDTNNANGLGYIVGYFSSTVADYHDRNTMTIDAFDWIHRSGANPPDDKVTGADEACTSRPSFPYRMESTFAHEYQHLLEYYASPGELSWVNEGLSDYAMRKTGFARPEIPQGQIGSEGHIQCFLGNLGSTIAGVPYGGAENSLTWWGDQGGNREILCDYGAAWSFMDYLEGQFGQAFMTALHNEDANGLAGLQAVLDQFLTGRNAQDVVHEWLAAIALDNALDTQKIKGATRESVYQIPTLATAVNWANDQSYSTPGAPPNGGDFVRLRDAAGTPLSAAQVQSLSFSGQRQFDPDPLGWKVVDGALSADLTDNLLNRTLAREVTVPAANPTLTFKGKYELEGALGLRVRPGLDRCGQDVHVARVLEHEQRRRAGRPPARDRERSRVQRAAADVPRRDVRSLGVRGQDGRAHVPRSHRLGHGRQRRRHLERRLVRRRRHARRHPALRRHVARRLEVGDAGLPDARRRLDGPARRLPHGRHRPRVPRLGLARRRLHRDARQGQAPPDHRRRGRRRRRDRHLRRADRIDREVRPPRAPRERSSAARRLSFSPRLPGAPRGAPEADPRGEAGAAG